MDTIRNFFTFPMIGRFPGAVAYVKGSDQYPEINGRVSFFAMHSGTFVMAQVTGLPFMNGNARISEEGAECAKHPVFGFHIHSGNSCTGTAGTPFANAGGHFNPDNCDHPNHAGDMPPLFGNDGYALSAFYTNKFTPADIIGRTVIIHDNPDDFVTHPSGASGIMIACGEIVRS